MRYTDRDTLKKLSSEHVKLREWLQMNRDSFCQAIGMWADNDTLVLMLVKMREYAGGRFPMFKDDIDRARCDAITPLGFAQWEHPAQRVWHLPNGNGRR
jgi:hypothetical protein